MFHREPKMIARAVALAFADIFVVVFSAFFSLWIRFDFEYKKVELKYIETIAQMLPFVIILTVLVFIVFRLYQSVWKYASANELIQSALAVITIGVIQYASFMLFQIKVPRSYYVFFMMFQGVGTVGIRFSYRFLRILKSKRLSKRSGDFTQNVMIVGAGAAGNNLMKEAESSPFVTMHIKCLIDDDRERQGKYMRGIPIVGGREAIPKAAEMYQIDEIIIALPTASRKDIKKIVEICKETGCKIRILPGIYQLINGEVSISKLREVEIEDLLGREPVRINVDEVAGYIKGKTVMVTGGGGSIGSELCRQIAAHERKRLVIVDIYENNAYDIQQELRRKYPKLNLIVLIASVRDEHKLDQIFRKYKPKIVYHAAAHKHVPLMEDSPGEAIKNNVFGTYNTARMADKYGAEKFVLVSTDKAVNPTNIMGASKRMCEMVIQMMNEESDTDFVAVRFGNVLGSNGSVIPLFKKQILAGGPVTVTDPDIIRYFMTIPEAVSLILQAGAYATGGEIFVLDMGEPVRILDLAKNLIQLSGYKVGEDIEIVFTGLRPGEKMYEELLMSEEGLQNTQNELIHIGKPIDFSRKEFKEKLPRLKEIAENRPDLVKDYVKEIVSTYHPSK
ncbi:MAG: polysaccharide biosynthesis protein [Lachnospiraceae bacterium]|nr:polysaccharide biosynthesis protein [Lachnospiraceae bacterium]